MARSNKTSRPSRTFNYAKNEGKRPHANTDIPIQPRAMWAAQIVELVEWSRGNTQFSSSLKSYNNSNTFYSRDHNKLQAARASFTLPSCPLLEGDFVKEQIILRKRFWMEAWTPLWNDRAYLWSVIVVLSTALFSFGVPEQATMLEALPKGSTSQVITRKGYTKIPEQNSTGALSCSVIP